VTPLPLLILGLTQGVRHAFEPDHIAAVGVFVSEERSPRRVPLIGLLWGAGHTATLLLAGSILWALRATIPLWVGRLAEGVVAAVLIALGIGAIARTGRDALVVHAHPHSHGPHLVHAHAHAHLSSSPAVGEHTHFRRPLLMGLVHGLAGSGALTVLVAATAPTLPVAIFYIIIFGLGSAVGMTMASAVLGIPGTVAGRSRTLLRWVKLVAGAVSVGVGMILLAGTIRGE
jgi:hypothetical protein